VVREDRLRVFVDRPRSADRVRRLTAGLASLPLGSVRVDRLAEFPRTPSGKTDYAALERQADLLADAPEPVDDPVAPVTPASVRDLYAVLLARPDATVADSFVALGGDSLSFVEVSLRLGARLGHLPAGWAHLSPEELAGSARRRRRWRGAPVEVSVLLRAVAILLVVVTHADLVLVPGGAHVLLGVAGFNLARFILRTPGRTDRVRRLLGGLARVALPAAAWIGLVAVTVGGYRPATLVYLNGVLGPDTWTDDWQFWFLEALVWSYLGLAAILAVPFADRWLRTHPFGVAMGAVTATLLLRYAWTGVEAGATERYTVGLVLWCVALGWAAAEATTVRRRILVTVVAVVATAGFFGDLQREAVVLAGLVLLVWVRTVPVPTALATPVRLVAGASLWIYLTHWQVYPGLEAAGRPVPAVLASVAAGICCWWVVERGVRALRGARPSTPRRLPTCGAATPRGSASRPR
jgi:peptidoglycan/LPS O-acetylase OafA/YrhL